MAVETIVHYAEFFCKGKKGSSFNTVKITRKYVLKMLPEYLARVFIKKLLPKLHKLIIVQLMKLKRFK